MHKPSLSILIAPIIGTLAGYMVACVLPPKEPAARPPEHQLSRKSSAEEVGQLKISYAKEVFQKRVELQGLRDLYDSKAQELGYGTETEFYGVPSKFVSSMAVYTVDKNHRLYDSVSVFLRLSSDERQKTDAAVWRAWVALTHEEAKTVVVRRVNDDLIQINVGPFDAKAIQTQLQQELVDAIGEERVEILWLFNNRTSLRSMFLAFDSGALQPIKIFRTDGQWYYSSVVGTFFNIPSPIAGRFYGKLPPEIQELIEPEYRGLPQLSDRLGDGK